MIAERLEAAKIVFGIKGALAKVIEDLCARSSIPDLTEHFRIQKPDENNERYSYIGDGIAVPHVRIDNLAAPELILGLPPKGFRLTTIKSMSSWFLPRRRSSRRNIYSSCSASARYCRPSATSF